jgi:hypothetical protein
MKFYHNISPSLTQKTTITQQCSLYPQKININYFLNTRNLKAIHLLADKVSQ